LGTLGRVLRGGPKSTGISIKVGRLIFGGKIFSGKDIGDPGGRGRRRGGGGRWEGGKGRGRARRRRGEKRRWG